MTARQEVDGSTKKGSENVLVTIKVTCACAARALLHRENAARKRKDYPRANYTTLPFLTRDTVIVIDDEKQYSRRTTRYYIWTNLFFTCKISISLYLSISLSLEKILFMDFFYTILWSCLFVKNDAVCINYCTNEIKLNQNYLPRKCILMLFNSLHYELVRFSANNFAIFDEIHFSWIDSFLYVDFPALRKKKKYYL